MFRIGFGYDAHRLVEGRALILGGVKIPHPTGLEGHSDADVLTHAVMDAVIGALALGDIGQHFPNTDAAYQGADSLVLLGKTMELATERGFEVNNLDATVVAQEPKLASHLPLMRKKLGQVLNVSINQINIKATTTEGMGFCGLQEGITAYAVISLTRTF